MAQLSTIISSILRDMVFAQHQANMYAITLGDVYKKGGRAESFPLPGVALGEMEIEITYGVSGIDNEKEQYEINYPQLRGYCKTISFQVAKLLTRAAIAKVRELHVDDDTNTLNLIEQLESDATTRQRFYTFLSRKIIRELQSDSTSLIDENGTVNQKVLSSSALEVANENILYNDELRALFSLPVDGKLLRDLVREAMEKTLDDNLASLLEGVNLKRKRIMPSVDVVVNSSELAKMPEDCLNTFRFKISPKEINMSMVDDDEPTIYE